MHSKMSQPHSSQGASTLTYDPAKSHTSSDQLQAWLQAPVTDDLMQVPGIGTANANQLANPKHGNPITSQYQLLGAMLSCKHAGCSTVEMCDRFIHGLAATGITQRRDCIVEACAEKLNVMMPGLYDKSLFPSKK